MSLKTFFSKKINFVLLGILVVLIGTVYFIGAFMINVHVYNSHVFKHNSLVERYNRCLSKVDVSNLTNISKQIEPKDSIRNGVAGYLEAIKYGLGPMSIRAANDEMAKLVASDINGYLIARQIFNPKESWVIKRLERIEGIEGLQAVTEKKDPNNMLGIKGGYTSCVYFNHKDISLNIVTGNDIVEKGTDCGGAIEVYEDKEAAEMRCNYLLQYDNTLLYSGSYAILGTIVIRTSALLTDEKQVELTNKIFEEFTKVDDFGNWEM